MSAEATRAAPETHAAEVVKTFLSLLAADQLTEAIELLAPDVEYTNVSLPTIRGRERIRRVLRMTLGRPGVGFEVFFHSVSADGDVVLTERTDALTYGPLRAQFWVCGRFEVRGGEITVWRDYFDWLNITLATLRGVLGIALPAIRPKLPA